MPHAAKGTIPDQAPLRQDGDSFAYLTPEDVENELRVSRATVYRLLRSGELPHFRLKRKIRIRKKVFDDWCRARERQA